MSPPLFYLRYDGVTTDIHGEGYPVGQYARGGYQVWAAPEASKPTPIHGRGTDLAAWTAFCRIVAETHGYSVPSLAAPEDLRPALGVVPVEPVWIPRGCLDDDDPFARNVWCRDPYDRASVARCLADGRTASAFIPVADRDGVLPPQWDAQRIAQFVLHPDPTPIEIQVTSTHGHYDIEDGWHRLAAAFYRYDETVKVRIDGDPIGAALAFPLDQRRPTSTSNKVV